MRTSLRVLLIGDIVGKPGRRIVEQAVPHLRRRQRLDLVIANGENAADGSGITPAIHHKLIAAGVDCVTLGDHIYRRNEIRETLETENNILRPANYPPDAPGKGWTVVTAADGTEAAVFSLLGRVFMKPVDCPFLAADRVLKEIPDSVHVRLLDFHAEATSDKQLMGRYLDGRVSAVVGTHTHVPTADSQVFPGGTAFQCDLGMTGPHLSILGRRIDRVLETTMTFQPTQFDVATDDVRLNGAIIEIETATGRSLSIERYMTTADEVKEWAAAEQAAKKTPLM